MVEFVGDADEQMLHLSKLIATVSRLGGFISDSIEFKADLASGLGIYAKSHSDIVIEAGTTLIRVPYKLCISVDMILQTPLKQIIDDMPDLLNYPDEILALGLMYARKPLQQNDDVVINDDYSLLDHVKTLPLTFNTTLYWTDEEIVSLKPTNTFHLTRLMKNQITNDWGNIHQELSQQYPELLSHITLDLYTWAISVVYSRAVGITRGGKWIRCIPPVLDMANHSPIENKEAADTFSYNEVEDTINFSTAVLTEPGSECFAIYGKYPNGKLAFTYGFAIFNNTHRAIDLWTRVSPSNFQAEKKQIILNNHPLTKNQAYDFAGTVRENYVSPSLLATVRVIQITDEAEMDNVGKAFAGEMISVRNEMASYSSLRSLLVARMNVDVAEQERMKLGEMLLDGTPKDNRQLISLVTKVDERELLHETILLVDGWISSLSTQGLEYKCPEKYY